MANTDLENKALSRIVYYDKITARGKFYQRSHSGPVLLSEFLYPSEKEELKKKYGIDVDEDPKYKNWKYIGSYDDSAGSGMTAVMIETAPGQASFAFRGTEFTADAKQLYDDFVRADIGLLNSVQTAQHKKVDDFLQFAKREGFFDRYEITMTGHSLGGNLAEYATIKSVDMGLDDRIVSCVSLDGPGFSKAFIDKYREQIRKVSNKMIHYQWSFVGTLLYDLQDFGVTYQVIQVKDGAGRFARHSLKYVPVDENGDFLIDEDGYGTLEKVISDITEASDTVASFWDQFSFNTLSGSFGVTGILVYTAFHATLHWVSDRVSGVLEFFAARYQRRARAKAAADPNFTLDTDAFFRIAEQFKGLSTKLSNTSKALGSIRSHIDFTVDIPDSIPFDGAIEAVYNTLIDVVDKIDELVNATSSSARKAERARDIIDKVVEYLEETAQDVRTVEAGAENLMKEWRGLHGLD